MSDIKIVIALLCKHLNLSTGATLKPEHFSLAKYDKREHNTVDELWTVLYLLSCCAIQETEDNVNFHDYDKITLVKLHLAYLQYPVVELYALPPNDTCGSRELLVAVAWLLATQNVLSIAIKLKISNSVLAEEYSNTEAPKTNLTDCNPQTINAQMNSVIHTCGKISYNLKTIAELTSEKIKLTTKVHAASLSASGLPHLSVSEMALTKRFAINDEETCTKDRQRLNKLHNLAIMLDTHAKWNKKRNVFFDWMVNYNVLQSLKFTELWETLDPREAMRTTVIEEQKKSPIQILTQDAECELSKFICILRHIVKKNLHNLRHNKRAQETLSQKADCVSRFLRIQTNNTEAECWLLEAETQLGLEEAGAQKKKDQLSVELETMLKFIPNCVQV